MSLNKLNHNAFSSVGGLLAVIALVLVGYTGYFVYRAQKTTSDTYMTAAQDASGTPKFAPDKKTATAGTATKQNELTIKEWSVNIPLPSTVDASDLYYVVKADTQYASAQEALLGSSKVKAVSTACDPSAKGSSPFGAVERMNATDYAAAAADPTNTSVNNGFKFGNYYYIWQVPRAICNGAAADASVEQVKANVHFPTNAEMPALLEKIQKA